MKADFVARPERNVPLDIVLGVREEEALAAVLVADAALGVADDGALRAELGGDVTGDALLAEDDLGRDLGDGAGDGLAGAAVVRHLELDGVADLQVLDVAAELAEVKEEARLPLAALNEPVRVQQLLDDAGLARAQVGGRIVATGAVGGVAVCDERLAVAAVEQVVGVEREGADGEARRRPGRRVG